LLRQGINTITARSTSCRTEHHGEPGRLPAGRQRLGKSTTLRRFSACALAHRHVTFAARRDISLDQPPHRPGPGDRAGRPAAVRAYDRRRTRAGRLPARQRDEGGYERVYALFPLCYDRRGQLRHARAASSKWSRWHGAHVTPAACHGRAFDGPGADLVERNFEIIKQVHESGVAARRGAERERLARSPTADAVLSTDRLVLGQDADLLNDEGPQGLFGR
jgi:hypothetical protein